MAQDAAVRNLISAPVVAPGVGVAAALKQAVMVAKSDVIDFDDTTTINLFEVGANVLVLGAFIHIKTAFDASGTSAAATATITVPNDTGGTDTILDCSTSGLQSTGFFLSTGIAVTPSSGGHIAMSFTPGTTVAGQMEVYLQYIQLPDALL